MKIKIQKYITATLLGAAVVGSISCNKFLDRQPYSVSPQAFFNSDNDLYAYSIARYGMFPTSTGWNAGALAIADDNTDNQILQNGTGNRWLSGQLKVPQNGNWSFGNLYTINYFFGQVMPKYEKSLITGSKVEIDHCIGEMYFFRAYYYFSSLRTIGDFPIIYRTLPDQREPLLAASIRQPRNKVARMILTDLDSAYMLMSDAPKGGKNRLGKLAVQLFKSRVALYEGTFEKNFANTAFVPNGPGWPGKEMHPSYAYDNAAEVDFFLSQAMAAAKEVAEAAPLAQNPDNYDYTKNNGLNGNASEYFEMFGTPNDGLNKVGEILLYRQFSMAENVANYCGTYLKTGANTGFTYQFMQSFVMQDGKPYYASNLYKGDDSINMMKLGRDSRMQIFVKGDGDILADDGLYERYKAPIVVNTGSERATTGYMIKKGISRDPSQYASGYGTTGSIIFRATEAYLNYIEACYEKTGAIDADAGKYWSAIRVRAHIPADYTTTANSTDMGQEGGPLGDLAAYTAGQLIDPTRHAIRRERRCEFIAEGMRMDDLIRWRAMDQLQATKYMPLGFNLWSSYYKRYVMQKWQSKADQDAGIPSQDSLDKAGNPIYEYTEPTAEEAGTVSAKNDPFAQGKYLVPFRLNLGTNNNFLQGITWVPAHYLLPIGADEFLNSTALPADGSRPDAANSRIYQNPGWSRVNNTLPGAVGGF